MDRRQLLGSVAGLAFGGIAFDIDEDIGVAEILKVKHTTFNLNTVIAVTFKDVMRKGKPWQRGMIEFYLDEQQTVVADEISEAFHADRGIIIDTVVDNSRAREWMIIKPTSIEKAVHAREDDTFTVEFEIYARRISDVA